MQVLLQEALDSYDASIVLNLPSNTVQEMENNVSTVEEWVQEFMSL